MRYTFQIEYLPDPSGAVPEPRTVSCDEVHLSGDTLTLFRESNSSVVTPGPQRPTHRAVMFVNLRAVRNISHVDG